MPRSSPLKLLSRDGTTQRLAAARNDAVGGCVVPVVTGHDDLTMSHRFFADAGPLSIIDSAAARESLHCGNSLCVAVDAASTATRCADRVGEFLDWSSAAGQHDALLEALRGRLAGALDFSPRIIELCVHACWLQHAVNGDRSGATSGHGPLLNVLCRFVRQREGACP